MAAVLQAVSFGDVNGDGELEVTFGTSSGYLYAVSGKTGRNIANFPFRTHGRIAAPVLITQLSQGLSQQLVVMSFDGHLYMVDGISGGTARQVVLSVMHRLNGASNVACHKAQHETFVITRALMHSSTKFTQVLCKLPSLTHSLAHLHTQLTVPLPIVHSPSVGWMAPSIAC